MSGVTPIKKILIANRGEIALRIARTANRLGIETVAIYSDADYKSNYVRQFSEAYRVGPPPSAESYLNVDKIVEIIKESGANAVHPGYGFLSENYMFVDRLAAEGIIFIGPTATSMQLLGDKLKSKEIARDAKVNTVPGFIGEVRDEDHVFEIVKDIGYPIMMKASSGGGGKGMRIARNDGDVVAGFKFSQEEALKSFGDKRILIERYV
jgi:propionyl-CoA carboxylase alpha chain